MPEAHELIPGCHGLRAEERAQINEVDRTIGLQSEVLHVFKQTGDDEFPRVCVALLNGAFHEI